MERRFRSLMTCLVLLTLGLSARAEDDEISVQLVPAEGRLPEIVCVAELEPDAKAAIATDDPSVLFGSPGPVDSKQVEAAEGKTVKVGSEDLKKAGELLHSRAGDALLFGNDPVCAPTVTLSRSRKAIACRSNPLAGAHGRGVVILDVAAGSEVSRSVDIVNPTGNIVSIVLVKKSTPALQSAASKMKVRIAGGHFQDTLWQTVGTKGATLALKPLCYEREVPLPLLDRSEGSAVTLTASYEGNKSVVPAASPANTRSLTVALPDGDEGHVAKFKVDFKDSGAATLASFESSWTSASPPSDIVLRPTALGFAWKVANEFPDKAHLHGSDTGDLQDCPDARLVNAGLKSSGTRTGDLCQYSFVSGSGPMDLPAPVTFSAPHLPDWHGTLLRAGQTMDDYLTAQDREFIVEVPWADQAQTLADEIQYIELVGPAGTRHLLAPQPRSRVVLPYAASGDRLSYRLKGDREFHWGDVSIEHGVLEIPSPSERASVASLGLALGGGVMSMTDLKRTRPFGVGEIAVQLKPKHWGETCSLLWALKRFEYELGFTYLFAAQPYRPVHTEDQGNTPLRSVPYDRFLFEGRMLWPVASVLYAGLGGGVGFGVPFFQADNDRAGAGHPVWDISARLRYDFTQHFGLALTGRVIGTDHFHEFDGGEFRGTPNESTNQRMTWLFGDLTLRGWI